MGQVMLIYRIVFFLFEKTESPIKNIFKILISIFLIVIILKYGQYFLNGILDKGISYTNEYQEGEGFSYIWATILSIIKLFVLLYEIFLFYKFREYFKQKGNLSAI